jgi:signal transduction histidine kinase
MARLPTRLREILPVLVAREWARILLTTALVAGAYVAGAKAAFALAVVHTSIAPIWPPSGIALVAVLLLGYRAVPGVWLGALAINASTPVPLWVSATIAVGNTLEAGAGAWLLRRAGFSPALDRVRDVFALAGLAALASTTLSASVGVTSLWASGTLTDQSLPSAWVIWWSGDAAGVLTVAPLLLILWTRRWGGWPTPARLLEGAALAATLVLVANLAIILRVVGVFLVFPALAWAAVRFRQVGAAIASLFVAAVMVWATARGRGPFVDASLTRDLLLTQAFTGVVIATSVFLLAALAAERDNATRLLDATFDRLPVGMLLLNPDLTVRRGSRNAEQVLGVQLDPGMAARTLYRRLQMTDLSGGPWLAEGATVIDAARRAGGSHGELMITRYRTGKRMQVEYWAVPVYDSTTLAALAVLFRDVTALRRAEADRDRLLNRLVRVQEDERRELAVRLQHDVVHGLSALLVQLHRVEERLQSSDERARRSISRVIDTLSRSLQATRGLIFSLRPPLLDTQGLDAAINQQLSKVAVETGMRTDLRWPHDERVDDVLEAIVFRAVQEAVDNVVKHANASRLVVNGRVVDDRLVVEIMDNGIGFAPAQNGEATTERHPSLGAIAERIQLAGGAIGVRSAPNAGTTVSISVPIHAQP